MGNPVYRTYTVAGTELGPQAPINLDWLNVSQTTIAVWLESTGQYSVEGTLDDVNPPDQGGREGSAVPPRWFPLDAFPAATAASKYAWIQHPWLWLRINITAIGGNIEFKVQQAANSVVRG